ncbi:hypothetical protein Tco_1474941 [Tanacetum coccineum]
MTVLTYSSMFPPQKTPIPTLTTPLPTTPIISEAPTVTAIVPDLLLTVIQRLSDLERKFEAWIKVDHFEAIEASVEANLINEVKNQLSKFLPKAVSDLINPRIDVVQKNLALIAQSSSTLSQPSSKSAKSLN